MALSKAQKNQEEEVPETTKKIRHRRRRLGDEPSGKNIWLISFTDVMALMLTFFVLLFAMSHPKEQDWDEFTDRVQHQFNRFYGLAFNRGARDDLNIEKVNTSRALDLNYLRALLRDLITKERSLQSITLMNHAGRLIISLPQDLLFEVGKADVLEKSKTSLFKLGGTLSRIKNRIEIVGHTDPSVMKSDIFASNWELSLARAAHVAAVLQSVGYDKSITIRGHASARYQDLSDQVDEETRMSLSRRVDIVVMEDDGKHLKLFDIGLP